MSPMQRGLLAYVVLPRTRKYIAHFALLHGTQGRCRLPHMGIHYTVHQTRDQLGEYRCLQWSCGPQYGVPGLSMISIKCCKYS
jgi:hypothetical protein